MKNVLFTNPFSNLNVFYLSKTQKISVKDQNGIKVPSVLVNNWNIMGAQDLLFGISKSEMIYIFLKV